MADNSTPNPQMGAAVQTPEQATDIAAVQAGLKDITGAEALALVQKQKEEASKPKPRGEDGKFKSPSVAESTSDPIKEAAKEAARKLKIDDQEVDEEEVIKIYKERKGHQQAANKLLQEGKAARKQAEEFIAMMKDPEKFLATAKKLGHDPRQLAEKYLATQLEEELLDPREKELRDTKAKLKHLEDLETKQKKAVEEQRNAALKAKYAKDYSDQFVQALKETSIPATKPMVAEMAKYVSRAASLGFKMTALEAAQLVKEDIQLAHRNLIGSSDGETLIKLLGEEVANKIRAIDVAKLKSPEQYLSTPQVQGTRREPRQPGNKRMSAKEWREFNRKK